MSRPSPDSYVADTPGVGEIPTWVLRDKFLELSARGEIDAYTMAIRAGWTERHRKPSGRVYEHVDAHRVNRALGLRPYHAGHGYPPRMRETVARDVAALLWEAMGLDPVDSDGWL